MKKLFLSAFLALALLFVATMNLQAADRGTYIDCIHGCSDLIVCNDCCNETFSSILAYCDMVYINCEMECFRDGRCLDQCMFDKHVCLMQEKRDFNCPHWKVGGPQPGLTKSVSCGLDCHIY